MVGLRVKRGKDWIFPNNQDNHGKSIGTVVGVSGHVKLPLQVKWDHSDKVFIYHIKYLRVLTRLSSRWL